jgi:hypothetical protein
MPRNVVERGFCQLKHCEGWPAAMADSPPTTSVVSASPRCQPRFHDPSGTLQAAASKLHDRHAPSPQPPHNGRNRYQGRGFARQPQYQERKREQRQQDDQRDAQTVSDAWEAAPAGAQPRSKTRIGGSNLPLDLAQRVAFMPFQHLHLPMATPVWNQLPS